VGGPAIRNMATVGGNLFAEAPYGDFAVALLALDAMVMAGKRKLSIENFLAGREQFRDIVTAVTLDLPEAEDFRFVKITRIKPKGSSVITIAAHLETSPDGLVKSARIALGCMAKTPMRAVQAERALRGARLTEQGIAAAVAVVAEATAAITDAVASSWYRREVLPVHFRRLLLASPAA
jgi:CO/xanthine dehydrogenase FAD-binding subunit